MLKAHKCISVSSSLRQHVKDLHIRKRSNNRKSILHSRCHILTVYASFFSEGGRDRLVTGLKKDCFSRKYFILLFYTDLPYIYCNQILYIAVGEHTKHFEKARVGGGGGGGGCILDTRYHSSLLNWRKMDIFLSVALSGIFPSFSHFIYIYNVCTKKLIANKNTK